NNAWNAKDYHQHSSVQYDAAMQLLKQIPLKGCETVLDVGCGDGKITAKIAESVPQGAVIGIDTSSDMVNFACQTCPKSKYPNLNFLVQDAQSFDYSHELDIVFTSFALQWLP